jgi:hypothetical protein
LLAKNADEGSIQIGSLPEAIGDPPPLKSLRDAAGFVEFRLSDARRPHAPASSA